MYIIGMIILTFFAIIGIATLIDAAYRAISRVRGDLILVLPLLGADDAEARTRQAARLCEQAAGSAVVCICDAGSEAEAICTRLRDEYPTVVVTESASFGGEA